MTYKGIKLVFWLLLYPLLAPILILMGIPLVFILCFVCAENYEDFKRELYPALSDIGEYVSLPYTLVKGFARRTK